MGAKSNVSKQIKIQRNKLGKIRKRKQSKSRKLINEYESIHKEPSFVQPDSEQMDVNDLTKEIQKVVVSSTWHNLLENFKRAKAEVPSITCASCGGLFYKKSVVNISVSDTVIKLLSLDFIPEDNNKAKMICKTCDTDIHLGKLPKLSLKNGLSFPTLPQELKELTNLEERLLALRTPFMQIKSSNYAGSKFLKGNIVNVPNNIDYNKKFPGLPRKFPNTANLNVMLVRKMSYKTPYMFENVRMNKIKEAGKYLCKTPLYLREKAIYYDNWEVDCINITDEQFEVKPKEMNEEDTESDSEDEIKTTDETLVLNNNEWMNLALKLAPGQGSTPLSILLDNNAEEMSFPSIYCGQPRILKNPKISYTDIVKSEVRNFERRSIKPTVILYKYRKLIYEKVLSQIHICLRKKKKTSHEKITAKDVLTPEGIQKLIDHDDGYRLLQNIRSSPPFWESQKKKILAMIRQLGQPTFFITLSAADTKWIELLSQLYYTKYGIIPDETFIKQLKFAEKMDLINSDPITCVQHYNHRFQSFLNLLIKSPAGIFAPYKVTEYYWRYEFQHRGSVHTHMMIWLEDSPKFDVENPKTIETCASFIDEFIATERVFEEDELADLIQYQIHKHSTACRRIRKERKFCRFHYPRPPMPFTDILLPIECDKNTRKIHEGNYNRIQCVLRSMGRNFKENKSFTSLLSDLDLSYDEYLKAIRSSIKRPAIFVKRNVNASFINGYNRKLLQTWEANIDIQFILNPYSCATYVTNYISKSDSGVSKILRDIDQEVKRGNAGLKERLRKIGNAFNNFSEITQQEAAIGCLGLNVIGCSISDIYINTSAPEERVRLLKSKDLLQVLPPDSEDILAKNILDRYIVRPKIMETTTLASFGTKYNFYKNKPNSQNKITLGQGLGFLVPRKKPLILRYRKYSEKCDPLNYYREMLMLFHPWRNESRDILIDPCAKFHRSDVMNMVLQEKAQYFSTSFGTNVEAIDIPADKSFEERSFDQVFYEDFCCDVLEDLGLDRSNPHIKKILIPKLVNDKIFRENVRKLNVLERKILLDCIHRIRTNQIPFYKFISGGAGVGKTHTILVLVQAILRLCYGTEGSSLEDVFVLVCAPTGKAAFNVLGMTLHHAFRLPPNQGTRNLSVLDSSSINSMRVKYKKLKLLIIDEVSMVPNTQFHQLDKRMRSIFERDIPFGGVSVIVVGHFRQLPPVAAPYIFKPLATPLASLSFHPWELFHLNELTEIMRQKDDLLFCTALNNFAEDTMTQADIDFFKSREIGPNLQPPPGAQYLFYTHADCSEYNMQVHRTTAGDLIESIAIDRIQSWGNLTPKDEQQLLNHAKSLSINEADGLSSQVTIKQNARYSITVNIDVEDGLFNGAIGVLKKIIRAHTASGISHPPKIQIYFENPIVGAKKRGNLQFKHSENNTRCWTTIEPYTRILQQVGRNGKGQVVRTQVPVKPADAITIHYSQGSDLKGYVLCLKKLSRQLMYTGLSRAPTAKDLFLLGKFENPPPLPPNDPVTLEMERLRKLDNGWNLQYLQDFHDNEFKLIFLNVQSIRAHFDDVFSDECYSNADLIIFVEPMLKEEDNIHFPGFHVLYRLNCVDRRNSDGVLILKNTSSKITCSISTKIVNYEDKQMAFYVIQTNNIKIIAVYISPAFPIQLAVENLDKIISKNIPTVVVGDFNVDFFENNSIYKLMSGNKYEKATPNYPSTKSGSQIDVCFTNIYLSSWYYESIFTFHEPICVVWTRNDNIHLLSKISSNQLHQTTEDAFKSNKHFGIDFVLNSNQSKMNILSLNTIAQTVLTKLQLDIKINANIIEENFNESIQGFLDSLKLTFETSQLHTYNQETLDDISINILPKAFSNILNPVYTNPDGNCFYRALSWQLFGNQHKYAIFRLAIFLELLINESMYKEMLQKMFVPNPEIEYKNLLISAKTKGAWATQTHIFAASKILRRPIYIYQFASNDLLQNMDEHSLQQYFEKLNHPRFKQYSYYANINSNTPIHIHFRGSDIYSNANHFVALLPKTINDTTFKCNYNEYFMVNEL